MVPFRRDELTNAFVESERVQLGEDSLVLVKNQGQLPDQVDGLLKAIARPGFQRRDALQGLPRGWSLFTDVQILSAPISASKYPDLNPLVPVISSQLSIAGGMKLPGNLRKWSALRPPEIRAVSQLDNELALSLSRMQLASGDAIESHSWQSQRGVLLVDLAEMELEDGDYELKLDTGNRALQRSILRLRSSDTPDRWTWDTAVVVGYHPDQPLTATTAIDQFDGSSHVVRGASVPATTHQIMKPSATKIGQIWWSANRPPRQSSVPIVIAAPNPKSCVVTGAHRIQLPPTPMGKPPSPMLSGSCSQCGIEKRYPSWPRRNRPRSSDLGAEISISDRLAQIASADTLVVDHDVALDALVHLGGGTVTSLDRVITQVDSSAIAADSFRRSLEVLGHVDLSRNERLEVTSWSIAPPALAEAADGSFYLVGAWSDSARAQLEQNVNDVGGKYSYEENREGPRSWFVEGLTASTVADLLPGLRDLLPSDAPVKIVPRAASALLNILPQLSRVGAKLCRVPMPGARKIERFNVTAAYWEPVQTAATPGAYRLESAFRTLYVYRSDADIERQEAAVGTAQLVKHLEAQRLGRPLLGYYSKSRLLVVALGADLPGMYGRAAVLSSGRLPQKVKDQRAIAYHDVSKSFAEHIFDLFAT
ncbi:hypothetical protein [Pseudonocardia sp. T1-2H]|uniref:hypothetical protein n=1 Tax=Pseudonocardia sp. T1-2H TaxID=3128899 RepID=UPI003100F8D1